MANDLWRTPPSLFHNLNQQFNFIADMACSNQNKLCPVGFTQAHDSLSFDWADKLNQTGSYVWCNPPYSDPYPFVVKAVEAAQKGLGTVMLLNQDTSVGWFAKALTRIDEVWNVVPSPCPKGRRGYKSGRLDFLDAKGEPAKGNNKAQFILVFHPEPLDEIITKYIPKSVLMGSSASFSE